MSYLASVAAFWGVALLVMCALAKGAAAADANLVDDFDPDVSRDIDNMLAVVDETDGLVAVTCDDGCVQCSMWAAVGDVQ